jgi:hypothetical protein
VATALAAEAPCAVSAADFVAVLVALDAAPYRRDAVEDVSRQLPCLADPLWPHEAALLHRLRARDAWAAGDAWTALAEGAVARDLDPDAAPPLGLAEAWARATRITSAGEVLVEEGQLARVDGTITTALPARGPALIQFRVGDRWYSTYREAVPTPAEVAALLAADPIVPRAADAQAEAVGKAPRRLRVEARKPVEKHRLLGGGAALVVSAGLFAASAALNHTFFHPEGTDVDTVDELAGVGYATNLTLVGSYAAGAAGMAMIAAGTLRVEWR